MIDRTYKAINATNHQSYSDEWLELLKMQWAKNASLQPRDSDLVDWSLLGVAVSYCDIVVTENQMADLFSRGSTRAQQLSLN